MVNANRIELILTGIYNQLLIQNRIQLLSLEQHEMRLSFSPSRKAEMATIRKSIRESETYLKES